MDIDPLAIVTVIAYFLLVWVLPLLAARLLILIITSNSKWKPTKKRKWLWAALLASIWATYPWFVAVEDINGRVVDVNGQPMEGVRVTAEWREFFRVPRIGVHTFDHRVTGLINVVESVTDADGRYHFPGFFHVSPPLLWRMGEPDVKFFKKGLRADYNATFFPKNRGSFKTDLLQHSILNRISVVMVEKVVTKPHAKRKEKLGVTRAPAGYIINTEASRVRASEPNAVRAIENTNEVVEEFPTRPIVMNMEVVATSTIPSDYIIRAGVNPDSPSKVDGERAIENAETKAESVRNATGT